MGGRRFPHPPRGTRVFENTAHLRPGQIHAHQGVHQTDPLRVTFEMTQILTHLAAQIVQAIFALTQA
ncbi:Uncharacterised protein [Klebsiella pneumoniae]|nr:Uncharacterised protein [Klebsiella pneumoniae]